LEGSCADSLRMAAIKEGKRTWDRQKAFYWGQPIFSTFALLPWDPMLNPRGGVVVN